jgi:hypothetical protein
MRGLSRTLVARTFATLLALLAGSPFTAPFMTCDWSAAAQHRLADVAHLGRNGVTAPDVKTPSDLNTTLFTVVTTTVGATDDDRLKASPLPNAPEHAQVFVRVLRI